MATVEENLRTFLLADSSISAKVGDRVLFNNADQGTRTPYIFYQNIGGSDEAGLDESPATANRPMFAIESISPDPYESVVLKNLVQTRVNRYRGTFGDSTVKGIFAAPVDASYEPKGNASDRGLHVKTITAEVVL